MVVPVNPMNLGEELAHIVDDSGAKVMIAAQDLYRARRAARRRRPRARDRRVLLRRLDGADRPRGPGLGERAARGAVGTGSARGGATRSNAASRPARTSPAPTTCACCPTPRARPACPRAACTRTATSCTRRSPCRSGTATYQDEIGARRAAVVPRHRHAEQHELADLLGRHHRADAALGSRGRGAADPALPGHRRWTASRRWSSTSSPSPGIEQYDLSSLRSIGGGGAAMPEAVAQRLEELFGLAFIEGYGLTETIAPTHINPPHRPKQQCLGIPIFDIDSRVVDPETLGELPRRRGRRDRHPRPAGLRRLLEEPGAPTRPASSRSTASASSAPATSAASTRTATSSSSIASSA